MMMEWSTVRDRLLCHCYSSDRWWSPRTVSHRPSHHVHYLPDAQARRRLVCPWWSHIAHSRPETFCVRLLKILDGRSGVLCLDDDGDDDDVKCVFVYYCSLYFTSTALHCLLIGMCRKPKIGSGSVSVQNYSTTTQVVSN